MITTCRACPKSRDGNGVVVYCYEREEWVFGDSSKSCELAEAVKPDAKGEDEGRLDN